MTKVKSETVFEILLVEDNAADILLLQEALEDINQNIYLHVVNNGEEAMSFLQQDKLFSAAARPDLILLDLNLPKKNGFSVLEDIKKDANLQQIPAIVLSTSQAQEDVNRCYQLHANCFVSKPLDLPHFMETIQNICKFWLDIVKLPKQTENQTKIS